MGFLHNRMRRIAAITLALIFCLAGLGMTAERDTSEQSVFIGGEPIGISVDVGGYLVESVTGVETEYGLAAVPGLCRGDIIKRIDGVDVRRAEDISELITGDTASVELVRGGLAMTVEVKPIADAYTKKPRLGIKVKKKVYGVGTVTFVREDGSFAALGHEIFDTDTGVRIPFAGGALHECRTVGVKRGKKGEAGAILASVRTEKVCGELSCNNRFGVGGRMYTRPVGERIALASRDEVKPGHAKLRTTVGSVAEYYDIEIIKAVRQASRREKGIVFRVTDKRLLELTGGVVRGMSGSPIIQNGKLVGAVTHVFLNDFTKGYGVYADCLN